MAKLTMPRDWNELPVLSASGSGEDVRSVDRDEVLAAYRRYGLILFRSFAIGIDNFRAIVNSYSNAQVPYPGRRRQAVSSDGMVQTVDTGAEAIPLHSELSHTPFRPDVCWFYCARAPRSGSATTLCDGSMLAASLPRSVCDVLEPRTLRYARTVPVEYLQRLLGTTEPARLHTFLTADAAGQYFKLNGDKVRQDFLAPALSRAKFLRAPVFANNIIHNFRPGRPLLYPTFEDGGVIPEPLIHSIREAADRCIVSVQWQDEDLLMLDNTRYLHGRRAVVDPDRAIWTQFSDADF